MIGDFGEDDTFPTNLAIWDEMFSIANRESSVAMKRIGEFWFDTRQQEFTATNRLNNWTGDDFSNSLDTVPSFWIDIIEVTEYSKIETTDVWEGRWIIDIFFKEKGATGAESNRKLTKRSETRLDWDNAVSS